MTAKLRIAGHDVHVRVFTGGVFEGRPPDVRTSVPYKIREDADGTMTVSINGARGTAAAVEATAHALARVFEEADAILSRHPFATKVYVPAEVSAPTPVGVPRRSDLPFAGDVD